MDKTAKGPALHIKKPTPEKKLRKKSRASLSEGVSPWLLRISRALRSRSDRKLIGLAVVAGMAIRAAMGMKNEFKREHIRWNGLAICSVSLMRSYTGAPDGKDRFVREYLVRIVGVPGTSKAFHKFVRGYIFKIAGVSVQVHTIL